MRKELLLQQENLFAAVYTLIDEYYRFGHLYNDQGELTNRYKISYLGEDGLLYDADSKLLDEDPFEIHSYMVANKYLDVHNNKYFDELDQQAVISLTSEDVIQHYIGGNIKKLIAILRAGKSYACIEPIGYNMSDDYITLIITQVWKHFVVRTLDCHDIKKKFFLPGNDYYSDPEVSYKWDMLPYYDKISDPEDIVIKPFYFSLSLDEEEMSKTLVRKQKKLARQKDIAEVINLRAIESLQEIYKTIYGEADSSSSDESVE